VQGRRLARKNPGTGQRRSLREIAAELAQLGHRGPSRKSYFPASISHMLTGWSRRNGLLPPGMNVLTKPVALAVLGNKSER